MTNLRSRIKTIEEKQFIKKNDLRDCVIEAYERDGVEYYTSKIDGIERKLGDYPYSYSGKVVVIPHL